MEQSFKVTPWEVQGNVDYEKLVKEFGVQHIDDLLLKRIEKATGKPPHQFLKRKIFFAHRDLDWLLGDYEKGNKFYLYTGRGPSENMHLGHLVPFMFTKWLQDSFGVDLWIQLTDDEKFLFKKDLPMEKATEYAYENAYDIIALGFDPKRTKIVIDSLYSKTLYNNAVKVSKHITFSTAKAVFGFGNDTNIGSVFYTAMQSSLAFIPSVLAGKNIPCLIPHGIDQDPHFRVSRDILPKMGFYKPAQIEGKFLPPLQGVEGKMSASDPTTAVFTTDSPEVLEKKVKKYAFSGGRDTVEEHRRLGGNPDIDISYQWLRFFEEDDKKLEKIYHDYKSGALLTGELKMILIEKLAAFQKSHLEKREKAKKQVEKFLVRD
ncbi:MAG: tryptophan--tRNA ligase [Candidatus Bilamarchaeaceae archaeon]